jgi:hypothetical protein
LPLQLVIKHSKIGVNLKSLPKIIIAGLAMGLFIKACFNLNFNSPDYFGGRLYFVVLYLIKGIDKNILQELKSK